MFNNSSLVIFTSDPLSDLLSDLLSDPQEIIISDSKSKIE